jgi:outer membrane protein
MRRLFTCLFTLFTLGGLNAQDHPLDHYLSEALDNNIALQRQDLSYQRSLAALREAKAMFLPNLSLQARYSAARGGRAFVIPVGDLTNPIFQNLNLINDLAGELYPDYPTLPRYPFIENEKEYFLRRSEQETFARIAWPVFNAAILYNQRIQENLVEAQYNDRESYRRELIKEVKTAYFQYLKALQAAELYENTLALVRENLRVAESLARNHQVAIDQVYAARAQEEEIAQELAYARRQAQVAKAYFNFLLNRPAETEVEAQEGRAVAPPELNLEAARSRALRNREELRQLGAFAAAADNQVKLQRGAMLPSLSTAIDFGIQGINYDLTPDAGYVMGSIVLRWNLFDRPNQARVQQARIERADLEKRREELERQIGLQVVDAYYALQADRAAIESARAEEEAAEKAFRLVRKKYSQGQANQVELLNARTQMTNAGLKHIIARQDYQISLANFERVIAF